MTNQNPDPERVSVWCDTEEIHPDWVRVLSTFHEVGLVREVDMLGVRRYLGEGAVVAPSPGAIGALLLGHYAGDCREAEVRREGDRVAALHGHEPRTADLLLSRIGQAEPELAPLTVRREGRPGEVVLASGDGRRVGLRDLRAERLGTRVTGKPVLLMTVSVRAVVCAANAILAMRDQPRRLLPLLSAPGLDVYASVTEQTAERLAESGLLAARLGRLRAFAFWDTRPPPCPPPLPPEASEPEMHDDAPPPPAGIFGPGVRQVHMRTITGRPMLGTDD